MKKILFGALISVCVYIPAMIIAYIMGNAYGGEAPLGIGYVIISTWRLYLPFSIIVSSILNYYKSRKVVIWFNVIYWIVFLILCCYGLSINNLSFFIPF